VLLLAAILFICNTWGYDLWAPDEPFFGEGAREMIADGQWLVTHINGTVNTHKPPLFFWLIALLSLPIGKITSLTARLPSALAALGTVAMTLRLGRRSSSARTAVLAAFILATTYMFWDKARSVQIDAVMCCLIWVALSAFEAWRAGDLGGRRAGSIFWAAGALAVLAKGPVGLLLPLGIAIVTLTVDRQIGRWRNFAPFTGPLLFAAICGAWVAATMLWGPAEYSVWGALEEHFVARGIHGMHHAQPWWYYAKVLPPQLLPWTFLVPSALVLAWRRRDRVDRFLLVTVIFVILFFSISTEKRTLYVLPAFPAFALLTARSLGVMFGWDEGPAISRRWVTAGQSILAGLLVLLGAAAPFAAQRVDEVPPWVLYLLAGVLLATGASTLWATIKRNLFAAAVAPGIGFAAAFVFVAIVVYPMADAFKSSREFAEVIANETAESRASGHRVLAFDLGNLPIHYAFYTDGIYTIETKDVADLARHLDRDDRVFAVANAQRLDELPPGIRERVEIITTTRASRRDVALIANYAPVDPDKKRKTRDAVPLSRPMSGE
jgi:4-amino-4-deoxy-L-arabinose transferase-like glycosyltransferase